MSDTQHDPAPRLDQIVAHPEHFDLADDDGVAWAMRRLAEAKGRVEHYTQLRDAEVEKLDSWLGDHTHGDLRMIEAMEALLLRFAELARNSGRKTIVTPYGDVQSRKVPGRWVLVDEDAFLAAVDDDELVKTTRHPIMRALAARLVGDSTTAIDKTTGEVVPGVAWFPDSVSYSVKADRGMTPDPAVDLDDTPLVTRTGKVLTDDEIDGYVAEAEAGYDIGARADTKGDDPAGGALDHALAAEAE